MRLKQPQIEDDLKNKGDPVNKDDPRRLPK